MRTLTAASGLFLVTLILICMIPLRTTAQGDPCKDDVPYILCDGTPGCAERARANIKRKEDECRARRNPPRTLTPEELEARRREAERLAEERRREEERLRLINSIDAEMDRMAKEQRNAELSTQIDQEINKQTFEKGDKINAPSAESGGGNPSDPDIGKPADNWNAERVNLIKQRQAYPNQRFLNGPVPKDGEVVEGCKWETVSWKIWPWGCGDPDGRGCEGINGRNPVSGYIADAFGRPADLGGYIVVSNVGSYPAWFGIGSLGGAFNNGALPPKSKRKIYAGKYINRKTKIVSNDLSVRYCVPIKE
jgi:hypothetical protein